MKLEYPLLGLLAAHRMTGYDIKKWLVTEGQFLGLDRHASQIYRELNKMQVESWIEYDVDRRSGPDAKVYRLTTSGLDRLLRWIRSPYEPPLRFQAPEFPVRLMFTAMFDAPRAIELVRTELDFRVLQVWQNRGRDRSVAADDPAPGADIDQLRFVGDQIHQHGMTAIDTWIGWLRVLLDKLENTAPRDLITAEQAGY